VAALCRDLERSASLTSGRPVGSVFFGGGTPSLLDGEQIRSVMDAVAHPLPDAA
jgi:oxygen-independent coproporphyrinogen-3 oxidase